MDIDTLVKATSRAWSQDILAQLHQGIPGRQVALLDATGAGRTALAHSIQHLVLSGFIERNPGHGHPLRPEFRLTHLGVTVAAVAHRIRGASNGQGGDSLLRRKWTVPILAVSQNPCNFSQIKRSLPPITDRALSLALKSLHAKRWMKRSVDTDLCPPRTIYSSCGVGAQIAMAVFAMQP